MKKGLTELVFILDRSGSMAGLEADTIGGFNAMIARQRETAGDVYVSTVLFSNESTVLHDRVDIRKIEPLTERQYVVGGCTALLDAMGQSIRHIGNVHKYARAADRPEHTLFVITTDGMENASSTYTVAQVKALIERQRSRYGWEFLFLGANMDAVTAAQDMGIDPSRAVRYRSDAVGTRKNFKAVSDAVCCMRSKGTIPAAWSAPIEEDYRDRE